MQKLIKSLVNRAGQVILDKDTQIQLALSCLFSRGHLLIEDLPGIGKTTLAQTLARLLGLEFQRIQCTNDLLPGDILGVTIFNRNQNQFEFKPGPIFAQLILVDEINRATPKTQSGLLECMAEGQVTIDRHTYQLPKPFFVIATQNPLEQSGTYPLPESQLDRFQMRISMDYPSYSSELKLLYGKNPADQVKKLEPILNPEQLLKIQDNSAQVKASEALIKYILDLLQFTRNQAGFLSGLSPRAGISLLNCAKSWSLIQGRDFVLPEDVKAVFPYTAGHRLKSSSQSQQMDREKVVDEILDSVPIP